MATTKTIQPTGETITIPAMTDRPDASVFATDVSRITDAVNSQNQALENMAERVYLTSSNNTWTNIYEKIRAIPNGHVATIYINNTPLNILTNGGMTTGSPMGTMIWMNDTTCHFMLKQTSNHLYLGTLITTSEGGFSSWNGRFLFDDSYETYKAGESILFEQVFVGISTNAKDGFYGSIALARPVASGVTATLRAGWTHYGRWYSDGNSHTLDTTQAIIGSITTNSVWFKIPATGITETGIAWLRLHGNIDFT